MSWRIAIFLWAVCVTPIAMADTKTWLLDASRLETAPIHYVEQATIKDFPIPVVSWRRPGLAGGEVKIETIKSDILLPILRESRKAISAFVVEFFPHDRQSIGLTVIWADGTTIETLISRNAEGKFDAGAWKVVFAKPVP